VPCCCRLSVSDSTSASNSSSAAGISALCVRLSYPAPRSCAVARSTRWRRNQRARLDDAGNDAPEFDLPDAEHPYRNHVETCRPVGGCRRARGNADRGQPLPDGGVAALVLSMVGTVQNVVGSDLRRPQVMEDCSPQ